MQAEIKERILKLMRLHGIQRFDYTNEQESISLSLSSDSQKSITAPFAGYFFQKHPMENQNQKTSSETRKGEIVGYMKNGPLLRPVIAAENCHTNVAKVVDGTFVSYGDALFDYSPASPNDHAH